MGTSVSRLSASPPPPAPQLAPTLLEVNGVTLRYKTPSALVTATDRVSFEVARSDRFVLLGPSGCGKSTLLKGVGGYLRPSEGNIRINGREVTEPGADRMMVFQEFDQLLPWKTVLENVTFPLAVARKLPARAARERAMAYIEKVHLEKFTDSYPHTLSGGMKQRVTIARGMAMEPDILLMDEPFAALDEITRAEMRYLLLELAEEREATVVFVTHSIAEAVMLSDRVIVMTGRPGRIEADRAIPLVRPRQPEQEETAEFFALATELRRALRTGHRP
jgi:sulfonate transport system ATP-binding protein